MAQDKLFSLISSNDLEGVQDLLQEETELDLKKRNENGITPLDLSALLGRKEITELLSQKTEPNTANVSGYSPLHLSAMWGNLECLKVLINSGGGDYLMETRHNENVKQLALRYNQTECVGFIECTEAKTELKENISGARETLSNSERIAGKWNKEDKSKVTGLCNEKTEWLDRNPDAEAGEIRNQVEDFEKRYDVYLSKLNIT